MTDILFVCSKNQDRSSLAEEYFSTHPKTKHHAYTSAWTNQKWVDIAKAKRSNYEWEWTIEPNFLTFDHLKKQDIIYVMTKHHADLILSWISNNEPTFRPQIIKRLFVLWVSDNYSRFKNSQVMMLANFFQEELVPILSLSDKQEMINQSQEKFNLIA